ncbi:MAG: metallophosphoesterase [Dehalococcoidia bacterium]|nr:metallophosphoesterase [Dehalococcoidia bacterium]
MRQARIVLFGDTHLGFDLPGRARIDRRRRGHDFAANFERVLDHIRRTRPHAVVHGGDVFHRSRVPAPVVEEGLSGLAGIAGLGIPVFIVPGNHDRSKLPASLWLGQPNLHVFREPGHMVIEAGGMRIAMGGFPFAWGDLRPRFAGLLAQTALASAEADARFLCMHHTVSGATVGPKGHVFRSGPDVVPMKELPATLTAVLAGHIHRRQELRREGRPPVFYPGSIERTSFAERDEAKGFLDITVAAPGGEAARVVHTEFIELPARPMVDVELPACLAAGDVAGFLAAEGRRHPGDAVVRISAAAPAADVVAQLTADRLRAAFPPSMNIQLARGLFDAFE